MPEPLSWKIGFGMNVADLPAAQATFLHHVLVEHQLVGHAQQRVEAHVDLCLTAGADLVVLDLDLDAESLHREDHLGAQVLVLVHRRDREVALLVPDLVAEVLAALVARGVPPAFDRVDRMRRGVLVVVETHVVEDENSASGRSNRCRPGRSTRDGLPPFFAT